MQLEKGYIRPSKSQYASSFFFISKKDRKQCLVQDYQRINDCTMRNQYPLPLITDLITDLQGAHIYTKLDICWGYNNVRIKEGNEHKAAFKTCYSLYEPTLMFFGLCNSPATFQTMMNHMFHPVIAKHELLGTSIRVYMDDIAIATRTNNDDHTTAVTNVLALAAEHDLYFKLEKCLFHVVTPAKSLSLKTVILTPFRTVRISPESTSHSRILPQHPIIFPFACLIFLHVLPPFLTPSHRSRRSLSLHSSPPPSVVNGQPFSIHQSNFRPSSPRSHLSEPRAPFFPFIQQSTTLFLNCFDMTCNITFGQLTLGPCLLVSLDRLVSHSLSRAQVRHISPVFFLLILTLSLYY